MYTKSKIQLIREAIAIASNYRERLENLMEKYTIEDSVFAYNGEVLEVTQGYFVVKSTHTDLKEAIRECNGDFLNNGIRIINNKEFVVGEIRKKFMDCDKESKIFDINRLTDIR